MSTALIKFEIRLPLDQGTDANGNLSAQDIATRSFLANLANITPYTFSNDYQVDAGGVGTQYNLVFGLLTNVQAVTALALLNTLNTALGFQVMCYTYNVNQQP